MYKISFTISTIIICLFLMACYTRKEACLDTIASNFDVSADDNCDDCCKYPQLILNIRHMAGDSTFSTQNIYTNDLNQSYQLSDIRFYLSAFKIFKSNESNIYQVIETISNADKSVTISDDIKICRIADNTITIGSVKTFGTTDSISFNVGLNSDISNTEFVDLPSSHVLLNLNKLKDENNQTCLATVKFTKFNPPSETLNLCLTDPGSATKIAIDSTIFTAKGENIIYTIYTDYLQLFKNVNLDTSVTEIEKQVSKNFGNIIVVK